MRSQYRLNSGLSWGFWALLSIVLLAAPGLAQTGPFTRLQVLLPGENAAPGTLTGKTGTPETQIVGVPFDVTVRACDDGWQTVAGVTDAIAWHSSNGNAELPPTASLTGGVVIGSVTLGGAGTFTISGQDLSDPTIDTAYSANVVAVVVAGFQFAALADLDQTAGAPFTIEIAAVDSTGNPVGGFTGPVNLQQFTSYGPGRISPQIVTLDGGAWTGQIAVYRADETNSSRGNVNIYAYLPGDISRNGTSDPFVVHPGATNRALIILPGQTPLPGSLSGVTGSPATQGVDQPFRVELYATDDHWNPVGSGDVLSVDSSDPEASTPAAIALSDGVAQLSLHLGTIGVQTLTVTDLSNPSVRPMTTAPIVVIPSFAHHFEFDPLPPSIGAGVATLVKIRATDAGGTTIENFNGDVILAASTGPGSIAPATATFTDGEWFGVMRFFGAGEAVQVTCSDYATPPHLGVSEAIEVLPSAYVATQIILPGQTAQGGTTDGISGEPEVLAAGEEFTVQVRAVDQYFNRVPGINHGLIFKAEDENLEVPVGAALVDGEATIPLTLYLAGFQTMSVSDAVSQGIAAPPSSRFSVTPGPYAKLLLLAPGQTGRPGEPDGRVGTATDQSITYQFTVTVLAADQWYNQITGVGDLIHLSSTDPGAELAADTALYSGLAFLDVRLATGGFQQITVSSVSSPAVMSSTTQVRAISSGLHLEAEIAEAVVQAGVPFTLSVDMVNDAGSIIQEINSEVQVTVRNAQTQEPGRGDLSPASFQLLQGQRTLIMSYTFAEPIILEITGQSGATSALTEAIVVQPAAPSELTLASDPGWLRANRTAVISATITDAFGNPVPDQSVNFATAAGDNGSLTASGNKTDETSIVSLTDAAGVARVDYHSPRQAQVARVIASSGALSAEFELATALVDPGAGGGHITNYPNPFHPAESATTIAYVLDLDASVRVRAYTVSGSLVLDRQYAAGADGGSTGLNEITWDGRNGNGEPVASGGYIFYVEAEANGATQHVMRRKIGVVW